MHYDFVIVGGGTAGLSAAVYACRANKTAIVLERQSFGGQIVESPLVENYPGIKSVSGAVFASELFDQAESVGTQFACETVENISKDGERFLVKTDSSEYTATAVILAAGCEHRKLGIDGEEELIGGGVSYCALCDGAFFKDGVVAVVGGGNAAIGDALYLAGLAKKVYIVHRRDGFRAEPSSIEKCKKLDNIEFITNATVSRLIGDGELTGVELNVNGKKKMLDVDGLFVAIGQQPDNEAFGVRLDGSGYIIADNECRTDVKGIYAAGDCRQKEVRQLTTAAADGAIAVSTAIKELF